MVAMLLVSAGLMVIFGEFRFARDQHATTPRSATPRDSRAATTCGSQAFRWAASRM